MRGRLAILWTIAAVGMLSLPASGPGEEHPINLAILDGLSNPAIAKAQGVIGETVHVMVRVAATGSYSLFSPLDTILGTASAADGNVTFARAALGSDGWYRVRQGSSETTKFYVREYGGNLSAGPSDVIRFRQSEVDAVPLEASYDLENLLWNVGASPQCGTSGANDPDTSVSIPKNTLKRLGFESKAYVTAGLPAPVIGLRFDVFGETVTSIPPNVGNNIIWIVQSLINPPPKETPYPMLTQAMVYISSLDQVQLLSYGRVLLVDLDQTEECKDFTDEFRLTVNVP